MLYNIILYCVLSCYIMLYCYIMHAMQQSGELRNTTLTLTINSSYVCITSK